MLVVSAIPRKMECDPVVATTAMPNTIPPPLQSNDLKWLKQKIDIYAKTCSFSIFLMNKMLKD